MSTVTVVRKDGLGAIAADTLTKHGYDKESAEYVANHEKIVEVGDNYLAVTGTMTSDHAVRSYFLKPKRKFRFGSVEQIFETWNEFHKALKDQYFVNPHEHSDDANESSRMEVLILNPHGIFGVSAYRSVQEFTKFYAYGSGNSFALGAMLMIYEQDFGAEHIARLGVQAAAEFDDATGLPITSYTVKFRK